MPTWNDLRRIVTRYDQQKGVLRRWLGRRAYSPYMLFVVRLLSDSSSDAQIPLETQYELIAAVFRIPMTERNRLSYSLAYHEIAQLFISDATGTVWHALEQLHHPLVIDEIASVLISDSKSMSFFGATLLLLLSHPHVVDTLVQYETEWHLSLTASVDDDPACSSRALTGTLCFYLGNASLDVCEAGTFQSFAISTWAFHVYHCAAHLGCRPAIPVFYRLGQEGSVAMQRILQHSAVHLFATMPRKDWQPDSKSQPRTRP